MIDFFKVKDIYKKSLIFGLIISLGSFIKIKKLSFSLFRKSGGQKSSKIKA